MIKLYLFFAFFSMTMGCLSIPVKRQKSVILVMSQDLQEALIPEMRFEGVLLSDVLESIIELTDTYRGSPNPSVTLMMNDDSILIYFNQGKNVVLEDGLCQKSIKDIEKELPVNVRLYGHYQWLTLRELIFHINNEVQVPCVWVKGF